jgi:hypothetical protein
MALPLRSRFACGGGAGDFTTKLPARAWQPADETVGGVRLAASGVPATYVVRRDATLEVTLRIEEAEWAALLALVAFGQSGEVITWFPDANEAESFAVYLHAPAPGQRWAPTRDADFPQVFQVALTLRGAAGAAPWLAYFASLT